MDKKKRKFNKKMLLLIPIIQLVVCFVCFSSATWSWLSDGLESNQSVISSASFDIEVKFENQIAEEAIEMVGEKNEYGYVVSLTDAGTYEITITPTSNSTAKNAYCKIVANRPGSFTQFFYKNIIRNGEVLDNSTIVVTTRETNVKLLIIPCCGISASDSFYDNVSDIYTTDLEIVFADSLED